MLHSVTNKEITGFQGQSNVRVGYQGQSNASINIDEVESGAIEDRMEKGLKGDQNRGPGLEVQQPIANEAFL